jgi:hypothetical protein
MRFHLALHVAVVEMKAIEIRVQRSQRRLVLHQISASLERSGLS